MKSRFDESTYPEMLGKPDGGIVCLNKAALSCFDLACQKYGVRMFFHTMELKRFYERQMHSNAAERSGVYAVSGVLGIGYVFVRCGTDMPDRYLHFTFFEGAGNVENYLTDFENLADLGEDAEAVCKRALCDLEELRKRNESDELHKMEQYLPRMFSELGLDAESIRLVEEKYRSSGRQQRKQVNIGAFLRTVNDRLRPVLLKHGITVRYLYDASVVRDSGVCLEPFGFSLTVAMILSVLCKLSVTQHVQVIVEPCGIGSQLTFRSEIGAGESLFCAIPLAAAAEKIRGTAEEDFRILAKFAGILGYEITCSVICGDENPETSLLDFDIRFYANVDGEFTFKQEELPWDPCAMAADVLAILFDGLHKS